MRPRLFLVPLFLVATVAAGQERLPVIDMHMHSFTIEPGEPTAVCTPFDPPVPLWDQREPFEEAWNAMTGSTPPCDDPVWSPETNEALMEETVAAMERFNVFGVLGDPNVERSAVIDEWLDAAPERFWAGTRCMLGLPNCSVEYLRKLHDAGRLEVLAELVPLLGGVPLDDERLTPYWALAEELDMPVGIHVSGFVPFTYQGLPQYRARMHSPLALEDVLARHPRMRLYVMHAGYPMLDEMLALMHAHPQVYVDIAAIVWHIPRAGFYRYLRAVVDAGFGKRVLFGTDNLQYPGLIERSIAVINEAPFLSERQKRDILYNNAARFLRLSEDEIARHHAMGRGE